MAALSLHVRGLRHKLDERRRLIPHAIGVLTFILLSLFTLWRFITHSSPHVPSLSSIAPKHQARLHLLVPATSSNPDLCKLLLSIQILGYPTPILINYGAPENSDPYIQHLAKVEGLLNYIRTLRDSPTYANDLVLIVDGYDIWFQLRPSVLLSRYFALKTAFDSDAGYLYTPAQRSAHHIRQTILFGPDKLCWPLLPDRPACWAVPSAPLPDDAFGPHTSQRTEEGIFQQPRWLNSGTIMGPVDDLVRLLNATLYEIHEHFIMNSDQLYFANLFGQQSLSRLALLPDGVERQWEEFHGGEGFDAEAYPGPEEPGEWTEFGVGLDYRSELFQTVAFYGNWLAWRRVGSSSSSWGGGNAADGLLRERYEYRVPEDVALSPAPFSALQEGRHRAVRDVVGTEGKGWADVDLCYNTATKTVPVLVHFTGNPAEKALRGQWWDRMWYWAKGRDLRIAGVKRRKGDEPLVREKVGGRWWFAAHGEDDAEVLSDGGERLDWDGLCTPHEELVYAPLN